MNAFRNPVEAARERIVRLKLELHELENAAAERGLDFQLSSGVNDADDGADFFASCVVSATMMLGLMLATRIADNLLEFQHRLTAPAFYLVSVVLPLGVQIRYMRRIRREKLARAARVNASLDRLAAQERIVAKPDFEVHVASLDEARRSIESLEARIAELRSAAESTFR